MKFGRISAAAGASPADTADTGEVSIPAQRIAVQNRFARQIIAL
jgi:hypothetical protein